jgi:flagellar export protein FliJ
VTRFRFPLDRLARVRSIQERLAREAWQAAMADVRVAEAELDTAHAAVDAARDDLRRLGATGVVDVARVLIAQRELARLDRGVVRFRERVVTLRERADRLRPAWQERRRDVAGLERLEEHARDAWIVEERRREARAMDEVAEMRAARRPRGCR